MRAGTSIELVATADYTDVLSRNCTAPPASVTLTVIQVAGVAIEFDQPAQPVSPGQTVYIPMRIINAGNGFDAIGVSVASAHGWSTSVIYDTNADGIRQSTEQTVITSTGMMDADGYCPCFAKVTVPSNAVTGDDITVSATSTFNSVQGRSLAVIHLAAPQKTATAMSVQASPSAPTAGDVVTVAGTVVPGGTYPLTANVISPTGNVSPKGFNTASNGAFQFQFTPTTVGTWQVNVAFAGNTKYAACSANINVVVSKVAGSIALTATPSAPEAGASVNVTGMLTPARQAPVTITRTDPTGATSQVTVTSSVSGSFSWNTSFDKAGNWKLTASSAATDTCTAAVKEISVAVTDSKPEHKLIVTSGATASPSAVTSAGTTQCSISVQDSQSHTLTYSWSDGGAGGTFSPSATVRNPTYTAKSNITGQDAIVTLTCTVTCSQDPQVKATDSASLVVHSLSASPARVVSVVPANGAECVALDSNIIVQFDKAMDRQATQQAITVPPGLMMPSFAWSADSRTLTIGHHGFLPGTTYNGIVGAGAKDATGQAIAEEYSWTFNTTSALRFVAPEVTAQPNTIFELPAILLDDPSLPSSVTFFVGVPAGFIVDTATLSGSLACVQAGSGVSMLFSEWDAQNREIAITASISDLRMGAEIVKAIKLTAPSTALAAQVTLDGCPALTVRTGNVVPGDFNGDAAVTISDASLFIQQWQRWHKNPLPVFDPIIDGKYDLAPRTPGAWPAWSPIGDRNINISDASAFIDCWVNARKAEAGATTASLAVDVAGAEFVSQRSRNAITVTVTDAPKGTFDVVVAIPEDAQFDPTVDAAGNLANVAPGKDAGPLFFTEYDPGTRTVRLTGSVAGRAPYKVATIYLVK